MMTIGFLTISNTFMTLAWYGHLKFGEMKWFNKLGIVSIIFISWGIAFFEYCFQVPANRIGFKNYGGPFSLVQLKVLQEVITLLVFTGFTILVLKMKPCAGIMPSVFFFLFLPYILFSEINSCRHRQFLDQYPDIPHRILDAALKPGIHRI